MTACSEGAAAEPAAVRLVGVPVLETARLRMRAPMAEDLDAEAAFYASDRSRFVGGPLPRRRVWRTLATLIGQWSMQGYGWWTVEERATGAVVGRVGLWNPDGWPERELGWTLFDGFEGRGYATEAARAARAHAYGALGWTTAISVIDPANAASQAVARRLGAVREGAFDHFGEFTAEIWRHPSPEAAGLETARPEAADLQAARPETARSEGTA